MEKLKNLIVEADGKTFETSPVIASVVVGMATSESIEEENLVAFVIDFEKQKLLVQVDKKNIAELKAGMFVIISGQISDEAIAVIPEFGVLKILEAEEVIFSLMEELDPEVAKLCK